jgi:hypothetical protein
MMPTPAERHAALREAKLTAPVPVRVKVREPVEAKRRTPLAPVGRAAREKAGTDGAAFGPQSEACRTLPCAVCGVDGPSDPHHEPLRSLGGTDRDTVPLCRACHSRRHRSTAPAFWLTMDPEDVKFGVRAWMNRHRIHDLP